MNMLEYEEQKSSQRETLAAAAKKYGAQPQKDQLIEECAELIVALRHERRGRDSLVVEELVDVEIMLEQMKMFYDPKLWADIREMKIERLAMRIK